MGLSPREIDNLSLWEFSAIIDAFNEAHGGSKGASDAELAAISEQIDKVPLIIRT